MSGRHSFKSWKRAGHSRRENEHVFLMLRRATTSRQLKLVGDFSVMNTKKRQPGGLLTKIPMSLLINFESHDYLHLDWQIMEEVASDNRTHMAAIGKEYQEMVNQLITVRAQQNNEP